VASGAGPPTTNDPHPEKRRAKRMGIAPTGKAARPSLIEPIPVWTEIGAERLSHPALSLNALLERVIGGFPCDGHIVRVRLPQTP